MDLQSLPWYGQLAIFLFIGGLVLGLFYMLYYSDGQRQIEKIDVQIENVEQEIKRAEKKESQLGQIQEEIKAKEKILDDLKEVLPEHKEIAQILRKVQGIVSGARLRIQNWATQNDRRREVVSEMPISITVDGNYHNLAIFFDQLSRLKKIFTVNNLNIKPLTKMSSTFSISASFIASTYTYAERSRSKSR